MHYSITVLTFEMHFLNSECHLLLNLCDTYLTDSIDSNNKRRREREGKYMEKGNIWRREVYFECYPTHLPLYFLSAFYVLNIILRISVSSSLLSDCSGLSVGVGLIGVTSYDSVSMSVSILPSSRERLWTLAFRLCVQTVQLPLYYMIFLRYCCSLQLYYNSSDSCEIHVL
jgi:hypothetical protein